MLTRNLTHLLNEVRISKVDDRLNVLNGGWVLEYLEGFVFRWTSPLCSPELNALPTIQDSYWSVVDNCTCPVRIIDRPGSMLLITRNYWCTVVILGCSQRSLFCDH